MPLLVKAKAILLGQVLSVLIAGTGVFSTWLQDRNVNIPTAQSFLNYVLLSLYLFLWHYRRRRPSGGGNPAAGNGNGGGGTTGTSGAGCCPEVAWWKYLLCAVADVEANYLVVTAYHYTTITSVTLLDCFSIPSCMILSFLVLGRVFSWAHVAAVLLCMGGLGILVWSDIQGAAAAAAAAAAANKTEPGQRPSAVPLDVTLGDMLCLCGTVLYAISNVSQEVLVKKHRIEYLGMLGFWGSLISGVQVALLERDDLAAIDWDWTIVGLIFGYVLVLFAMYTLTSLFLVHDDAVLFNLSLLTSDVWAIIGKFAQPQCARSRHPQKIRATRRPSRLPSGGPFSWVRLTRFWFIRSSTLPLNARLSFTWPLSVLPLVYCARCPSLQPERSSSARSCHLSTS